MLNWCVGSNQIERRATDRKVADSRFNSRTGNASLCPWERQVTVIPIGAKQSSRCGGPA